MKISGAIFDMDGTLTDSMHIWIDMAGQYLISCGINPREGLEKDIRHLTGVQMIAYLRKEYGLDRTLEEVSAGIGRLVEPYYRNTVPTKADVTLLLDRLREKGVKMCVASATDQSLVELVLGRLGLLDYFSAVFSCVTLLTGKEKPLIFEKALAHLGTPRAETFVFEDALYAAKTAKKAGFPIVGVYDPSAEDTIGEMIALSDIYIRDYRTGCLLF
ncbi:MAG: HAD family phosphatase [Oscillospiraceae bacterium]|jgi:HAD superfamily hydrolase (TIGR01509 family)|nr:HAD family phosphatase [Oscillospiraceae bacterium]